MLRLEAKQIKYIITLFIYALALSYIAWQMIYGNKGLVVYLKKREQLASERSKLMQLDLEHAALEHRILSLQSDALDRDLVDELSRKKLGLADPQEKIFLPQHQDDDRNISK